METYEIVFLVVVGIPIGLAGIWIAGFVISVIASPFIAAYEDVYGWARHPHVHRTMSDRAHALRMYTKRLGTHIGNAWRSMFNGIRNSEPVKHAVARRPGHRRG